MLWSCARASADLSFPPQNKQIDVALNSALASQPLATPSKRLSEEGHKLVADLRDVIEQAKLLVLTKNEGNLFQDFVWQTTQVSGANATLPGAPVTKDVAKQHGNEALNGLRTLGTLIITNGQFRKLRTISSNASLHDFRTLIEPQLTIS